MKFPRYYQITQRSHGYNQEFFKDETCNYPPCKEPGYGFSRGIILCKEHYYRAMELMKTIPEVKE